MHNRIKVLRAEHNLSQEGLAKLIGVSRQTMNAIERDKYAPSVLLAFRMARVFGCEVASIFQPTEEELDPSSG